MVCSVVASKAVARAPAGNALLTDDKGKFPLGMSLTLEYSLTELGEVAIVFHETVGGRRLIEESFPGDTFRGISPYTYLAEFKASYSEASFGRYSINYKGSDQLFIKTGCGDGNWQGHFVQTYVGGHATQVVSLDCRPKQHAADEFLSRLKASF